MLVALAGGFIRFVQGAAAAAPTLLVGLFIAAILRYYLGAAGTKRLFGGATLWSLPQSWLVGMLLPVCSIGVIPIIREMHRMGIRPGAITAFALAAPLFNPLSLLYGLTLSRPVVIVGFAAASLAVVTVLGLVWDRLAKSSTPESEPEEIQLVGLARLQATFVFTIRELCGPSGRLALVALGGLMLLGLALPHGALQSSVEQLDPMAPLRMAVVAVTIYATPMLTMSQLGMMFAHGNSPGAAFALLLLGTGVNLATLWWIHANYGLKPLLSWFATLFVVVVGLAYIVDRPLIPPGVEPAGHTHAFDIYTNPLQSGSVITIPAILQRLTDAVGLIDQIGLGVVAVLAVAGWMARIRQPVWSEAVYVSSPDSTAEEPPTSGWNQPVSPRVVGLTGLAGLIAFSVVACFAYYPKPSEVLEEMRLARAELLTGVSSRDYERVLHWIPVVEEWSRKLEVGYAMREFELRPYQQAQSHLLRKHLEMLKHATEHSQQLSKQLKLADSPSTNHPLPTNLSAELDQELAELDELRARITRCSLRLAVAFDMSPRY